jgi:hypothetical protein
MGNMIGRQTPEHYLLERWRIRRDALNAAISALEALEGERTAPSAPERKRGPGRGSRVGVGRKTKTKEQRREATRKSDTPVADRALAFLRGAGKAQRCTEIARGMKMPIGSAWSALRVLCADGRVMRHGRLYEVARGRRATKVGESFEVKWSGVDKHRSPADAVAAKGAAEGA